MNKLMKKNIILIGPLFLIACSSQIAPLNSTSSIQQSTSNSSLGQLSVDLNKYPAQKIVCDPLSGGQVAQTNYLKGIKAELFYKNSQQARMYKSTDYIQFAQKSEQILFLSDLNVATRMFTEGFSNRSGQTLTDDQGQKLIEYFGLKMTTNIVLSDLDEEGFYEFALLSDDGTTMSLKSGSSDILDEVIIDNDGDHPTKMGCSKRTIKMRRNVMAPVEVTFYQGPRYHIAHTLLWRKSTEAGKDSLCNQFGNELFFNPNKNSEPLQAFKDLQNRGWKILSPDNFMMAQTDFNPCVIGTQPVISDVLVSEVVLSNVSISWKTNIIATSQVQITNLETHEITETLSDNQLRTNHFIQLSQLKANTTYQVKAISVSSDLGRSESTEFIFQTQ